MGNGINGKGDVIPIRPIYNRFLLAVQLQDTSKQLNEADVDNQGFVKKSVKEGYVEG